MQKSGSINRSSNTASLKLTTPSQSLRRLGLCSQISTGGQQTSPIVFPEKRNKKSSSRRLEANASAKRTALNDNSDKVRREDHRIDIGGGGGDEKSDLLGYVVYSGKLILDKRKKPEINAADIEKAANEISSQDAVDAKLTSRALVWGSSMLSLDDVVSVRFSDAMNKGLGGSLLICRVLRLNNDSSSMIFFRYHTMLV